jgi:hypothetical protein
MVKHLPQILFCFYFIFFTFITYFYYSWRTYCFQIRQHRADTVAESSCIYAWALFLYTALPIVAWALRDAQSWIKRSDKEALEAAMKCDKISVRPLRIRLSQLKLQWGSCNFTQSQTFLAAFVSVIIDCDQCYLLIAFSTFAR